jgi:hypothetical protein
MRMKQDRTRRSGHKHSLNTQDFPSQHPPAYHNATNAERWCWRQSRRLRHLIAIMSDDHELERQAKELLLQAATDYEVRSGIKE